MKNYFVKISPIQKLTFVAFLFIIALSSCSKDSSDADEEKPNLEECNIEAEDQGCARVYLEGRESQWIRVAKQGNLADPQFMYPDGEREDPYGTVTIYLEEGNPVIRLNDMVVDDYLVRVSQSSEGSNYSCKVETDVETPSSDDDTPTIIRVSANLEFPFYIQLEANVCF